METKWNGFVVINPVTKQILGVYGSALKDMAETDAKNFALKFSFQVPQVLQIEASRRPRVGETYKP